MPTLSETQLHNSAIVLVGLALGALQVRGLYVAFASRTWSTVPGRVRKAALVQRSRYGESADVEYTYKVGALSCIASRVGFGLLYSDISAAEQVGLYRQFRDVTVHYNPENPDQAVLEPGPKPNQWFVLALSVAIVALGCWRLRHR